MIEYIITRILSGTATAVILRKRKHHPERHALMFSWGVSILWFVFLTVTDIVFGQSIESDVRYSIRMAWDMLILYNIIVTLRKALPYPHS